MIAAGGPDSSFALPVHIEKAPYFRPLLSLMPSVSEFPKKLALGAQKWNVTPIAGPFICASKLSFDAPLPELRSTP